MRVREGGPAGATQSQGQSWSKISVPQPSKGYQVACPTGGTIQALVHLSPPPPAPNPGGPSGDMSAHG